MKTKIFLFSFTFLSSIFVSGQTSVYHPFPDSNAVWIVRSGCTNSFIGNCIMIQCEIMTRYEQTNDTVINSKTYHKIETSSSWSCSPPCTQTCMPVDWSEHYIREDSTKRIWELQTFSMTDTLLYDFNLNIGDTIRTKLANMPGGWDYVVQSIDSVWVGNSWRTKYNYSSSGGPENCTQFLIEGIGGGGGLFSPLCAGFCFEVGYVLSCFKENNVLSYPGPPSCPWMVDTTTCDFHVSVAEIEPEKNISIFPSPAANQLEIRNTIFLDQGEIQIYNTLGDKVIHITDFKFSTSIDISKLEAGIYFMRLRSKGNYITKKFTIVR